MKLSCLECSGGKVVDVCFEVPEIWSVVDDSDVVGVEMI